MKRVPALLEPEPRPRVARVDAAHAQLERLAAEHLPGKAAAARSEKARHAAPAPRPRASQYLDVQLDTLRRMYDDMKSANYRENFAYLTARSLHVMASRRTSDFGDTRLFKASELQQALHDRGR